MSTRPPLLVLATRIATRITAGAAAISTLVCLQTTSANAGPREPTPILTTAPEMVGYKDTLEIGGRLRNGRPGQKVQLQRRRPGTRTRIIRREPVDKHLRVQFAVPRTKRTASYKLVFKTPQGRETKSDGRRVEVRPRLTFHVSPQHVRVGRKVTLRGRLLPRAPGRHVRIEMRVKRHWTRIDGGFAGDGAYRRRFKTRFPYRRRLRATFRGDRLNSSAVNHERLWVYNNGPATYYGPGFFGNRTACGRTLHPRTLGVAHRTLPCGTRVSLLYNRRTITVPVIDRGPYGASNWDLTQRTARRLHFSGRGTVGFISR